MNKKQEYKDFIVELAKLFTPRLYVEIGCKKGYVLNEVAKYCEIAVGVDIKIGFTKKSKNVVTYEMKSEEFSKRLTEEDKIDLLFIDADHSEKSVLNDFLKIGKFVIPETGLILLHDTFPINERLLKSDRCGSAWKTAKKIEEEFNRNYYEIVTLPGPWAGLSIVRKRLGRHGWMDK